MSDFNHRSAGPVLVDRADMAVDAGLRQFMLGVYNKVALGLVVSGAMAWLTGMYAPVRDLMFMVSADGRMAGMTPLGWIVSFAPLGIILFSSFARGGQTPRGAAVAYWSIVVLMGASLGVLTLVYTGQALAQTFLITAAAFAALSLFGYATKRDLTAMGSFLIVGLIGLVLASLVNIFLKLPIMSFIISILGVVIFAGLIAFDTQRLKMMYYDLGGDEASTSVATNYGALSLYLNFINLFQFLLNLLGERR
jgi:FtsH-binding integral membrane protein